METSSIPIITTIIGATIGSIGGNLARSDNKRPNSKGL